MDTENLIQILSYIILFYSEKKDKFRDRGGGNERENDWGTKKKGGRKREKRNGRTAKTTRTWTTGYLISYIFLFVFQELNKYNQNL